MGGIAFVFSGQGDQHPGMGRELLSYEAANRVFEMCDKLRPGTSSQCFSGTQEELTQTVNTQPCLFAVELAAASVLGERGICPDALAGFSLGEVTAAVTAGYLSPETGFRLVCKRGELMQAAADGVDAAMAAVVKLSEEAVKDICARFEQVYPVNFNCPGQITVSGLSSQMNAFSQAVREAGGRVIPLKVGGGFHSPFMKEASEAFAEALAGETVLQGAIPLYSNITARPYGADPAGMLSSQICSPVLWEQSVRNMIADGMETFIEIGPGRTLSNMIRKIDSTVRIYAVAELDQILREVQIC